MRDQEPNPTESKNQLLTIPEMADWLKLPEQEVEKMRERGELPFIRVAGQIRFPIALQKFTVVGGEQDGKTFACLPVFDNQQTAMHVAVSSPYDVFDEQDIADMLKCDTATVAYYTKRTNQLAYVPIGKKRFVLRKDLNAFFERRRVRAVAGIPLLRKGRTA